MVPLLALTMNCGQEIFEQGAVLLVVVLIPCPTLYLFVCHFFDQPCLALTEIMPS